MTEQKIVEEDLDFEIIREPWNKYKLEDGTILRLKNPAIKLYKTSQIDVFGLPVYRLGGITLLAVTVPKELRGTPSENEQVDATDISCEMKFSVICEDWCEYKLSDGMVFKSRTIVSKIVKTKKFNKEGEPLYWASWQVLADKLKP